MDNLYTLLNQYSFFQEREGYKIHEFQNYGRKSKFLVSYQNEYYTVIIEEERIRNYINKIKKLGDFYKNIIELKYLSEDYKVLVLNYYGGIEGKDLSYYSRNQIDLPDGLDKRLIHILNHIHSNKSPYININDLEDQNSWYEYVYSKLTKSLIKTYEYKGIKKEDITKIQNIIKKNKKYFETVETCYIHADVTSVNVCYNSATDQLYLIDFDDFMIGDPLFDYSRMFNFSKEIPVFAKIEKDLYPNIEENIIHLLYTLRVTLNWYWFILERNLENELPIEEINALLKKIYTLDKK